MSVLVPIHHTFAPHVTVGYALRSFVLLLQPWTYRRGRSVRVLRAKLTNKFQADVFLFASGREGLLALFKAMNLHPGEEIILQGYTCVVLPNAIHAAGAVPVYVDINRDTLNLDIDAVKSAITPHTRAIICQHTFGIPAETKALRSLCTEKNILFIEDCAHVLPDHTGPKDIGTSGDCVLLSFGRDKAISGVLGGAMICRNKGIATALQREWDRARPVPFHTVLRALLYPLLYFKARLVYGIGLGKLALKIARVLGILLPITTDDEKAGAMSPVLQKMPNACAALALAEFTKLKVINDHRRMLTNFYRSESEKRHWPMVAGVAKDLPLQKFPLFVKHAASIRSTLKKQNVHLDDGWTGCVVCPAGSKLESAAYVPGSDPEAEAACDMILSLPTHPTMSLSQAKKLVELLSLHLETRSAGSVTRANPAG